MSPRQSQPKQSGGASRRDVPERQPRPPQGGRGTDLEDEPGEEESDQDDLESDEIDDEERSSRAERR